MAAWLAQFLTLNRALPRLLSGQIERVTSCQLLSTWATRSTNPRGPQQACSGSANAVADADPQRESPNVLALQMEYHIHLMDALGVLCHDVMLSGSARTA